MVVMLSSARMFWSPIADACVHIHQNTFDRCSFHHYASAPLAKPPPVNPPPLAKHGKAPGGKAPAKAGAKHGKPPPAMPPPIAKHGKAPGGKALAKGLGVPVRKSHVKGKGSGPGIMKKPAMAKPKHLDGSVFPKQVGPKTGFPTVLPICDIDHVPPPGSVVDLDFIDLTERMVSLCEGDLVEDINRRLCLIRILRFAFTRNWAPIARLS